MTVTRPAALDLLDELRTPGSVLRRQLCVAVSTISSKIANEQQRALAQIWLPGFTPDGLIALTCAGAPYAIAGEGDLCALFRCVSCRYIIYPTSPDAEKRGSVGRAFLSHRPEICSNISTAPVELYHRAHEARQCLLHSLCVMPIWMPEVTRKAPVCVLEILQPETQPDFDSLHELTAQAFRAVTRCKVTVIAPMPDINTWTEGDECFVNPGHGRSGPTPPGQASMMREAMQRDNSTQPVDVPGAACVHTSLPGGEERMQVVFDERACAQNSDEHMAVLAERIAASNNCAVAVSTGGIQLDTLEGLREQQDTGGPSTSVAVGNTPLVTGAGCPEGHEERGDEMMHIQESNVALSRFPGAQHDGQVHNGSHPAKEAHADNSPNTAAAVRGDRGLQEEASAIGVPNSRQQQQSSAQPARHSAPGQVHPPEAACITASALEHASGGGGGAAVRALGEDGSMRGLTGAVALLDLVQQDKTWQAASQHGGSLKGRGVDLLAALHSQRPTSGNGGGGGGGGVNGPTVDDGRARKKRSSVQRNSVQEQEMKQCVDIHPQAGVPLHMHAEVQGDSLPHDDADKNGVLDPDCATRNGFTYPGSERQTFVKVSVPHGYNNIPASMHMPNAVHNSFCPDPAVAAMHVHHPSQRNGLSLHDKVQRAEGMHDPAVAILAAQNLQRTGSHDPAAFAAQHAVHAGAPVAAAPRMQGIPSHRLGPAIHHSMHADHAVAPQYGAVQVFTTGAPVTAAGPGLTHVGDIAAAPNPAAVAAAVGAPQVAYVTAEMHRNPSVHSVVVGPPGAGAAPMEMLGTLPHVTSAPSIMSASLGGHHSSGDLKALRNKVNRADGGIGRKLTLEVLQQYFGRGLKEAAESLGMCPTTLKRACRRLGVKRWPRTPELATQVIAQAQQAQRQQLAKLHARVGGAGVMVGDGWQSGGVGDEMVVGGDDVGLEEFEMERPGDLAGEGMRKPETMLAPNGQMGEFDDFLNMISTDMLEVSE